MGAGVIPLAVQDGEVFFLFQKTFSGRKMGCLIDFGGGVGAGENYRTTAVREFVEETETMYLDDSPGTPHRSDSRITSQITQVEEIFERTLSAHPHWWRQRKSPNPMKPKDWRTYFIEFPYVDVFVLNREWKSDTGGRFKKRRELVWVSAEALLDIYTRKPSALWKRVRQLEDAETLIGDIRSSLLG
ncbi:NUDIX domain-containing protein [Pseudomonadota bacterium]